MRVYCMLYQHWLKRIWKNYMFFNFIVKAVIFRGDHLKGGFSKTLKMFFFSVSDVLCAISVMQPTWTVVLCCTPFPTLRHDHPREKSAHAWYRMVHDQYLSSTGDPYTTKCLLILYMFCSDFFFFFKERKGQITMFFSLFLCKSHPVYSMSCVDSKKSSYASSDCSWSGLEMLRVGVRALGCWWTLVWILGHRWSSWRRLHWPL